VGYQLKSELNRGGTEADDFVRVKLPQRETTDLLKEIFCSFPVSGAWIWNTCQRFELYLLPQPGYRPDEVSRPVNKKLHLRFRVCPRGLSAGSAWRHLLEAAAGLQSKLPGDSDVLQQLHSAERMAEYVGVLGNGQQLLQFAYSTVRRLSQETGWGRYAASYPAVALQRVIDWQALPGKRIVIVGGSTTARTLLHHLVHDHKLPTQHIKMIYRGEARHSLVKELRQILGDAGRLRVNRYDDPAVLDLVAACDVAFYCTDGREPILTQAELIKRRPEPKPLQIIDFNLHGSTSEVATLPGVHLIAAEQLEAQIESYAVSLHSDHDFAEARLRMKEAIARDAFPEAFENEL
jgi:glutamyl-tRNA reductase